MYHDPPLVFDVEEDPGEQWPLDPEADAVKPLVHRAWREFQRLNATIVRHEPLQVGGDRKYAICQRERRTRSAATPHASSHVVGSRCKTGATFP